MAIKTKQELIDRLRELEGKKGAGKAQLQDMSLILADLIETTFGLLGDSGQGGETYTAGAFLESASQSEAMVGAESTASTPSPDLVLTGVGSGNGIYGQNADGLNEFSIEHIHEATGATGEVVHELRHQSTGDISFHTGGHEGTEMFRIGQNGSVVTNSLVVSKNNVDGGGIILSDDGDIVDLNDGYCSMRFSQGVRIYNARGQQGVVPAITLGKDGKVEATTMQSNEVVSNRTVTGHVQITGGYNGGLMGDNSSWTRLDPNGQRFIIPMPIERVNAGDEVLSIEDTTNWIHHFSLKANGDLNVRHLGADHIWAQQLRFEVSGNAEKQIRWVNNNDNGWGLFGHNAQLGVYDWVNGKFLMALNRSNNAVNFYGDLQTSGNITAFSDARLKENIRPIEFALDKVLKLEGVRYNRVDTEERREEIGVIAQKVKEVVPEVVLYDEERDTHSVDYGRLTALLLEAVKEQQKELEKLKAELSAIK